MLFFILIYFQAKLITNLSQKCQKKPTLTLTHFGPIQPIFENNKIFLKILFLPVFYYQVSSQGYSGVKLSSTSGCYPLMIIFSKISFIKRNVLCHEHRGGQVRGALFNLFVVKKKSLFCVFCTLPSLSKIIRASAITFYVK